MRHALVGAVIAAALFEVMKLLFVHYVNRVGDYSVVYGAFSSVPIFLLWLFCCWLVVLIGAEVAATLSYARHPWAHSAIASPDIEARVFAMIEASDESLPQERIRHHLKLPIDVTEDALDALLQAERIVATSARYGTRYSKP